MGSLLVGSAYGQEAKTENQVASQLTLSEAAKRFFQTEPTVAAARLNVAVNDVSVLAARDRFAISLSGTPDVRGQFLSGGPDQRRGLTGSATGAFKMQDRLGGEFTASLEGHAVSDPSFFIPGQGLSATLQYGVPLVRNRLGALWEMEALAAEASVNSAKAAQQAAHLQRCGAFLHLFVTAHSLQEQRDILNELLKLRERNFQRTSADFNKKLLTRLDYLASKSDLVAARQRLEALTGIQKGSLAALFVAMGEAAPSSEIALADEAAARAEKAVERDFEHPELQAFSAFSSAAQKRAAAVERKFSPELSIIPGVGAWGYSNYFFINSIRPTTDLWAGVSVGVDWPVVAPGRKYEPLSLRRQADEFTAKKEERRRQLSSSRERALANVSAAREQLALLEERVELAQAQLTEARATYLSGRLPFQDFLQHFVVYEESRLQRAVLNLELARAEIEAMVALGSEPTVCTQNSGGMP